MKKRIFAFGLALSLLFLCAGCKGSESGSDAVENAFSPLFRFAAAEGKSSETRFFFLKESEGFIYLHPKEGGGFIGGFVSPKRSVSSESIIRGEGELSFASVREREQDRAVVLTPDGIRHALLKENGAELTALPDDIDFSAGIFYDDLTLLGETEDLLLLCPIDFSESYVLAQKTLLLDFAEPLAVTHEQTRIWYSLTGEDGAYGGMAFFEYGKNTPMGSEKFDFHRVQSVGESALLFTRYLEDGGALYIYRDLEDNTAHSLTVDKAFDGVICDPEGEVFCGILNGESTGEVFIYDMEKATLRGSFPTAANIVPAAAIDDAGQNLLMAICSGNDEILGTLDLTQF